MEPVRSITATLIALSVSVSTAKADEMIFNFIAPGDFQDFTAPSAGEYQIISVGAVGGNSGPAQVGGDGAAVAGYFNLAQGTSLTIAVGDMGQAGINGSGGGGGGGTFVVANDNILLEAAGGGGGAGGDGGGLDGTSAQFGVAGVLGGMGGMFGNGGQAGNFGAVSGGAGGGGYISGGGTAIVFDTMGGDAMGGGSFIPAPPLLPLTGGAGEFRPMLCCGGNGGFGGGGGGGVGLPGYPDSGGGGGGGGYSGGGGGSPGGTGGGGGGSFISPLANFPLRASGVNPGNGEVLIAFDGQMFTNFEDIPEPRSIALSVPALIAILTARWRRRASPKSHSENAT
jgi:hypothetical protein